MAPLPTVAVAGATGKLGSHIIEALLSASFRSRFHDVVLLTRRQGADCNEWITKGARVILYSESDLRPSLAGVHIVIST
jgi:nucleoside-diphosphate-sugar epimerase